MKRDYGIFHVATKAILRKGNRILLLKMVIRGREYYDWPGGRVDNLEAGIPVQRVLAREIREELGPQVKYRLGQPLFQFYRYFKPRKVHIFLTAYSAKYLSGKIVLSSEHTSYEWIDPKKFKFQRNKFISSEEYQLIRKYFASWK